MAGGVLQFIDLILRSEQAKKDADKAGRAIGKNLESGVRSGTDKLLGWVKSVGAALGIAFGIKAIVDFGRASLKAADESDRAWADLNLTLAKQKINLSSVRGEVERLASTMLKATAFSDEEAVQGLNRLIQMTGNYRLSLQAVTVAADFAAAKHMSLEEASFLVGKALQGNTVALVRQGVQISKNKDVLEQLRAQFAGAAAVEMKTFGGQMKQLNNLWDEFKEEVGRAMVASNNGVSVMETLKGALIGLAEWVRMNKGSFASLGDSIRGVSNVIINDLLPSLNRIKPAWFATWSPLEAQIHGFTAMVLEALDATTRAMTNNLNGPSRITVLAEHYRELEKVAKETGETAQRALEKVEMGQMGMETLGKLPRKTSWHGGPSTLTPGVRSNVSALAKLTEQEAAALAQKQQGVLNDLLNSVAQASSDASDQVRRTLDALIAKYAELGGKVTPALKAAFNAAVASLTQQINQTDLGDTFSRAFADIDASVMEGFTSATLQNIVSQIDELRDQLERRLSAIPGFTTDQDKKSKEQLAIEKQLDDMLKRRNELSEKAVDLKNQENLTVNDTADAEEARVKTAQDMLTRLQLQGQAIQDAVNGALQLAEAFGLVDENVSSILQGLTQAGTHIASFAAQLKVFNAKTKDASGKPLVSAGDLVGAALPIAGGIAQAIKGIGSLFGQSPEMKKLSEAVMKNAEALRDNTSALEGLTSTQARGAIEGVEKLLLQNKAGGQSTGLFGFANMGFANRDDLDRWLRGVGSSLKELEEAAKAAGIDISDLAREEFVQLQEAISDTDLDALEAAEDLKAQAEATQKVADAANEAAAALKKQELFRQQRAQLDDDTSPLGLARSRANADRLIPALASTLSHNLGTEGGRQAADEEIRRLFEGAGNLTTWERGGLSVEDFRALLVEWEQNIDDIRQASEDEANAKKDALTEEQRLNEERQVANRQALEDQKEFADLQRRGHAVGGAAEQAVETAARLIAEALALAAGPLGADSPLFQDAQRRADEARAEAERLVGEEESKRAGDVEAGFTIQRTITESTGSQLMGELATQSILQEKGNEWLEKIYGALTGVVTPGAPAGAGPFQITTTVMLDGREVGRSVSGYLASEYQNRAGLGGNVGVPSN